MTDYTDKFRLPKQLSGGNKDTWGQVINKQIIDRVEDAIAGEATIVLTSSTYTLSANNGLADESRNMVLNLKGGPTSNTSVIVPTAPRLYFVRNNITSSVSVTIKTAAGTGVAVPKGSTRFLFVDGTNVVDAMPEVADSTLADGKSIGDIVSRNVGSGTSDIPDNDEIDTKLTPYVKEADLSQVPIGAIFPYAGENIPDGYLICDGSLVSRTTYKALFDVIGTTWGAGDGVTTFQIPDLRGRTAVGSGNGAGLTNRTLVEKGGVDNDNVEVTFPVFNWGTTGPGPGTIQSGRLVVGSGQKEQVERLESLRVAAGGRVVSDSVDNMPPYVALHYIINATSVDEDGGSEPIPDIGAVGYAQDKKTTGATTTAKIPTDGSIPQQSEGVEYQTLSYTPKFADSDLLVEFEALVDSSNNFNAATIVAMFRDSENDAIAVTRVWPESHAILRASVPANSTATTTFKIRFGLYETSSGHFAYINLGGGFELFSTAGYASLIITEHRQPT